MIGKIAILAWMVRNAKVDKNARMVWNAKIGYYCSSDCNDCLDGWDGKDRIDHTGKIAGIVSSETRFVIIDGMIWIPRKARIAGLSRRFVWLEMTA